MSHKNLYTATYLKARSHDEVQTPKEGEEKKHEYVVREFAVDDVKVTSNFQTDAVITGHYVFMGEGH